MVINTDIDNKTINPDEVEFIGFKSDNIGRVFKWQNKIYRAIVKESAQNVKELFSCGLINELVSKQLFPETKITDIKLNGYELVLEHHKIDVINYSFEWSFTMLKDAGIALLKVAEIAAKYGYEVKDGHSYNIIFDYTKPVFIDLGSFEKVKKDYKGWIAYPEFLKFFYYPLKLWRQNPGLARRIQHLPAYMVSTQSYLLYLNPFYRLLPNNFFQQLVDLYYKARIAAPFTTEDIEKMTSGKLKTAFISLKKSGLLPWQKTNFKKLIKDLETLPAPKNASMWKNYHSEHYKSDGTLKSTPRFDRIIEIVKSLPIDNILEIAGNQGIVSRHILNRTQVKRIICSDYDDNAIDILYNSVKNSDLHISPIVLDIKYPVNFNYTQLTEERFKSDAVFALALTHHLILTQLIPIDEVFQLIKKYSKKYVFIEFMPMGLFDGKKSPPFPEWYNQNWFRDNFSKAFNIIIEEQLEKNRILFVGEIK